MLIKLIKRLFGFDNKKKRVNPKCKDGHLGSFVSYVGNFNKMHHSWCLNYFPTHGVFKCRRCGVEYVAKIQYWKAKPRGSCCTNFKE